MHHLHENFHKKFKHPALGILLWQAARATSEDVYIDTIKKMRDINEKAVDWLLKKLNQNSGWSAILKGIVMATLRPISQSLSTLRSLQYANNLFWQCWRLFVNS